MRPKPVPLYKIPELPMRDCRFWDEPLSAAEEHERPLSDQWHDWQRVLEIITGIEAALVLCGAYDGELPY